jgi:hypothetical protein
VDINFIWMEQMNKRILELAEQAGMVKVLDQHAREYGDGTFKDTQYPELEKFAELIVQDCLDVMNTTAQKAHKELRYMGDDAPVSAYVFAIKQHFGEEE